MYELRRDSTTGEWVLIATDRAKRPQPFAARTAQELPLHDPNCPFCPGNEAQTPSEVAALRDGGAPNDSTWRIRVVPNKFPAVVANPSDHAPSDPGNARPAKGVHEVFIETPAHNRFFGEYSDRQAEEIWRIVRDRVRHLKSQPDVESVIVFKNSGLKSGISLIHPHGQIVALPLVPPVLLRRFNRLTEHRRQTGGCLICGMIQREMDENLRVVACRDGFVTLHPFAPRTPYETWVLPRDHVSSFDSLDDGTCAGFARALRDAICDLALLHGNLDFNLNLIDGCSAFDSAGHFHFFAKISPRMSAIAGFELGTDLFMNTHCPEETARQIQKVRKEEREHGALDRT